MDKANIVMIIPYFGNPPRYINYFLKTAVFNKNIDFYFFADSYFLDAVSNESNIRFQSMSFQGFNKLATKKLLLNINLQNPYKVCDFKPMYGEIFEDFINEYEFWGYCDVDLLLGNTSKFLTKNLLDSFDVISTHAQYLSGPFALFRNSKEVNKLFNKSKDIARVLTDRSYIAFDEASSVMPMLWSGHNIFDFESEVESMTHILKNPKKCIFRVKFGNFIEERVREEISWEDGQLLERNGVELLLFHFIIYKGKFDFNVSPYSSGNKKFYFTSNGFNVGTLKSKTIDRGVSFLVNFTRRTFAKIKKIKNNFIN